MIYSIKLLAYALLAALPAWFLTRLLLRDAMGEADFKRAWALLFAITVVSFLSRNSGLFMALLLVLMLMAAATESRGVPGAIAVYTLVSIVSPPVSHALANVGDINQLLSLRTGRVACLALLVIPAVKLLAAPKTTQNRWLSAVDLMIVGYALLKIIQTFSGSSVTYLVRQVVESVLDTLIPYYVITRGFGKTSEFPRLAAWFALGATYIACVGALEFALQKNIYAELQGMFGQQWQLTLRFLRGDYLRVQATTSQPILLGMLLVFGGAMVWLRWPDRHRRVAIWLTLLVFSAALLATFARGPLLGAMLFAVCWWLLNHLSVRQFRMLALGAVFSLVGLRWFGLDSVLISSLSQLLGGGAHGERTADYRQDLLDTGLALIAQSPWWGVPDYAAHMQNLKQGEGIIDMVNTYIAVTLDMGLVGLALYLGPILVVAHQLMNHLQQPALRADPQARIFLTSCVALICAFLAIIFTTSIYGIASYLMLLLVALPAAWMHAHGKSVAPPMAQAYRQPLTASRGVK